jgi:peptidoglycan hydrolase CwlO-like protein
MVKKIQDNLTNIVVVLGLIASIGAGFTKFAKMESSIEQLTEASKSLDIVSVELVESNKNGIETNSFEITDNRLNINKDQTAIAILQKEIEVLKLEISEIKESNKNPLQ